MPREESLWQVRRLRYLRACWEGAATWDRSLKGMIQKAGGEGQSTNVGELGGIPTPTPPRPPYLKKNQPENA